jgi:hypothetical protein
MIQYLVAYRCTASLWRRLESLLQGQSIIMEKVIPKYTITSSKLTDATRLHNLEAVVRCWLLFMPLDVWARRESNFNIARSLVLLLDRTSFFVAVWPCTVKTGRSLRDAIAT